MNKIYKNYNDNKTKGKFKLNIKFLESDLMIEICKNKIIY